MKNMFLLLFVASFVLLIPTVNGSETNVDQSLKHRTSMLSVASYPFKKIWEHKKKFAALTIITGYIGMTHWVDKKFQSIYIDYIAISDKSAYSDEIGKITDRLACLASTWFSMPY